MLTQLTACIHATKDVSSTRLSAVPPGRQGVAPEADMKQIRTAFEQFARDPEVRSQTRPSCCPRSTPQRHVTIINWRLRMCLPAHSICVVRGTQL